LLQRPNARELARYAGACIESFGTGGGNFRLMYAAVLEEVREQRYAPVVAEDIAGIRESARGWTDLSSRLRAFASGESDDVTAPAVALIGSIRDCEQRVFERLARSAG
jgi:hypothetical protein